MEAKWALTTLSCNFPVSRRPVKALRGPKNILDRSERTHSTHMVVNNSPQTGIAVWNKENLDKFNFLPRKGLFWSI